MKKDYLCYVLLLLFVFFMVPLTAAPVITTISPNAGLAQGGTNVTILGSGFTGTTTVTFGTEPAASFIVNSDTSITAISPAKVPGTVNIQVTTGSGSSPLTFSDLYTFIGDSFAYVTDLTTSSVYPVNLNTGAVGTAIPTGAGPFYLAITPDGQTAYISNQDSGTITPVNLATNTPLTSITAFTPADIAITPNGTTTYFIDKAPTAVFVIDIATNTIVNSFNVGSNPNGVALTPNGTLGFATSRDLNSVDVFDVATNTVINTLAVGSGPFYLAITPNGQTAYVVDQNSNDVTPFDIATDIAGAAIPVGAFPSAIAITPNGTKAYVTNTSDNTVTPIDLTTNTPGTIISIGFAPIGIAISPDGLTAYVVSQGDGISINGSVIPIDTTTDTVGTPIVFPANSILSNIAIAPDQSPVARFTTTPAIAGSPTTFDASGSVSPVGGISSYSWNFGDAFSTTTNTPIITHTYTLPGNYTVTLTVTNSAGTSTTQIFTGHTVSRNGGVLATLAQFVTIPAAPVPPVITNVNPNSGPTTGGNVVTITGLNFLGATTVKFGATSALSFIVLSDTMIIAVVPAGVPGTVDVTVTTPIGTSAFTPADAYTYLFAPPTPSAPLPPSHFRGRVVENKFATQIEYVHRLKWVPSPDPTVVGYKLFRNGRLISSISAQGPFKFHDHNRRKHKRDTYVLQAFNANGLLSIPLTLTLPKGS